MFYGGKRKTSFVDYVLYVINVLLGEKRRGICYSVGTRGGDFVSLSPNGRGSKERVICIHYVTLQCSTLQYIIWGKRTDFKEYDRNTRLWRPTKHLPTANSGGDLLCTKPIGVADLGLRRNRGKRLNVSVREKRNGWRRELQGTQRRCRRAGAQSPPPPHSLSPCFFRSRVQPRARLWLPANVRSPDLLVCEI